MTLRVGVTGGIGSGKSTVCSIIGAMGYPIYSSDVEAKKLMESDVAVVGSIAELFGEHIYINGKLDKQKVAMLVFNDRGLLARLNAIVHPVVVKHFDTWVYNHSSFPIVFQESAILFESGAFRQVNVSILVAAPVDVRVKRVVDRDKVTEGDVRSRVSNQLPEEELLAMADYVIKNDGFNLLLPQVVDIIDRLKQR